MNNQEMLEEIGRGISPKDLPRSGRHSQRPFADRILIGHDKIQKLSRFIFTDEGTRSLAPHGAVTFMTPS